MLFGLRRIFLWRYVWKCSWTFEILPWNRIRSLPCLWLFRDGFCRRHGAFFSWTERRSLRVGPLRWTVVNSCWSKLTCITYDTTINTLYRRLCSLRYNRTPKSKNGKWKMRQKRIELKYKYKGLSPPVHEFREEAVHFIAKIEVLHRFSKLVFVPRSTKSGDYQ